VPGLRNLPDIPFTLQAQLRFSRLMTSRGRRGDALRAIGAVARNRDLRRLQLANVGSVFGNWAYLVGLLVYAYDAGGAGAVSLVTVLRMIPAALAGPFMSVLGDRFGRRAVMVSSDVVRAGLMLAAAAVIAAGGAAWSVYLIICASAIVSTAFRPAYQAILPGLARTPDELAAANVATSTITSIGGVVGPALGGLLLAVSSVQFVFAFNAVSFVWSAALALAVREPEHARPIRRAKNPLGHEAAQGIGTIARHPDLRFLTTLYVAQTLVAGTLNVFVVLTAIQLTEKGDSWVGVFNAALGIGGLVGGAVALALVGRHRLAADFGLGLALFGGPLLVIAAIPEAWPAAVCFAAVGLGNTLVDVAASTLLQRTVPDEVLSRAFGALQSLLLASIGIGALLAPILVNLLGTKGAMIAAGSVLPVVALASWRRLRAIDGRVAAPAGTELLRRVPMLALLPESMLERLAGDSLEIRVAAGEVVFHEGDPGDRFYVVQEGEVEIAGKIFGPGEPFGEIALLRDVPRTATVTARIEVVLRAIGREDFVEAVTGQADAAEAADALIDSRLAPA
jgi:MFS family permease